MLRNMNNDSEVLAGPTSILYNEGSPSQRPHKNNHAEDDALRQQEDNKEKEEHPFASSPFKYRTDFVLSHHLENTSEFITMLFSAASVANTKRMVRHFDASSDHHQQSKRELSSFTTVEMTSNDSNTNFPLTYNVVTCLSNRKNNADAFVLNMNESNSTNIISAAAAPSQQDAVVSAVSIATMLERNTTSRTFIVEDQKQSSTNCTSVVEVVSTPFHLLLKNSGLAFIFERTLEHRIDALKTGKTASSAAAEIAHISLVLDRLRASCYWKKTSHHTTSSSDKKQHKDADDSSPSSPSVATTTTTKSLGLVDDKTAKWPTFLIGRDVHNASLKISASTKYTDYSNVFSRGHAAVVCIPFYGWCVLDLGSVNGTFVNRCRVPALSTDAFGNKLNDELTWLTTNSSSVQKCNQDAADNNNTNKIINVAGGIVLLNRLRHGDCLQFGSGRSLHKLLHPSVVFPKLLTKRFDYDEPVKAGPKSTDEYEVHGEKLLQQNQISYEFTVAEVENASPQPVAPTSAVKWKRGANGGEGIISETPIAVRSDVASSSRNDDSNKNADENHQVKSEKNNSIINSQHQQQNQNQDPDGISPIMSQQSNVSTTISTRNRRRHQQNQNQSQVMAKVVRRGMGLSQQQRNQSVQNQNHHNNNNNNSQTILVASLESVTDLGEDEEPLSHTLDDHHQQESRVREDAAVGDAHRKGEVNHNQNNNDNDDSFDDDEEEDEEEDETDDDDEGNNDNSIFQEEEFKERRREVLRQKLIAEYNSQRSKDPSRARGSKSSSSRLMNNNNNNNNPQQSSSSSLIRNRGKNDDGSQQTQNKNIINNNNSSSARSLLVGNNHQNSQDTSTKSLSTSQGDDDSLLGNDEDVLFSAPLPLNESVPIPESQILSWSAPGNNNDANDYGAIVVDDDEDSKQEEGAAVAAHQISLSQRQRGEANGIDSLFNNNNSSAPSNNNPAPIFRRKNNNNEDAAAVSSAASPSEKDKAADETTEESKKAAAAKKKKTTKEKVATTGTGRKPCGEKATRLILGFLEDEEKKIEEERKKKIEANMSEQDRLLKKVYAAKGEMMYYGNNNNNSTATDNTDGAITTNNTVKRMNTSRLAGNAVSMSDGDDSNMMLMGASRKKRQNSQQDDDEVGVNFENLFGNTNGNNNNNNNNIFEDNEHRNNNNEDSSEALITSHQLTESTVKQQPKKRLMRSNINNEISIGNNIDDEDSMLNHMMAMPSQPEEPKRKNNHTSSNNDKTNKDLDDQQAVAIDGSPRPNPNNKKNNNSTDLNNNRASSQFSIPTPSNDDNKKHENTNDDDDDVSSEDDDDGDDDENLAEAISRSNLQSQVQSTTAPPKKQPSQITDEIFQTCYNVWRRGATNVSSSRNNNNNNQALSSSATTNQQPQSSSSQQQKLQVQYLKQATESLVNNNRNVNNNNGGTTTRYLVKANPRSGQVSIVCSQQPQQGDDDDDDEADDNNTADNNRDFLDLEEFNTQLETRGKKLGLLQEDHLLALDKNTTLTQRQRQAQQNKTAMMMQSQKSILISSEEADERDLEEMERITELKQSQRNLRNNNNNNNNSQAAGGAGSLAQQQQRIPKDFISSASHQAGTAWPDPQFDNDDVAQEFHLSQANKIIQALNDSTNNNNNNNNNNMQDPSSMRKVIGLSQQSQQQHQQRMIMANNNKNLNAIVGLSSQKFLASQQQQKGNSNTATTRTGATRVLPASFSDDDENMNNNNNEDASSPASFRRNNNNNTNNNSSAAAAAAGSPLHFTSFNDLYHGGDHIVDSEKDFLNLQKQVLASNTKDLQQQQEEADNKNNKNNTKPKKKSAHEKFMEALKALGMTSNNNSNNRDDDDDIPNNNNNSEETSSSTSSIMNPLRYFTDIALETSTFAKELDLLRLSDPDQADEIEFSLQKLVGAFEESQHFYIPTRIYQNLRPHQVSAIQFMWARFSSFCHERDEKEREGETDNDLQKQQIAMFEKQEERQKQQEDKALIGSLLGHTNNQAKNKVKNVDEDDGENENKNDDDFGFMDFDQAPTASGQNKSKTNNNSKKKPSKNKPASKKSSKKKDSNEEALHNNTSPTPRNSTQKRADPAGSCLLAHQMGTGKTFTTIAFIFTVWEAHRRWLESQQPRAKRSRVLNASLDEISQMLCRNRENGDPERTYDDCESFEFDTVFRDQDCNKTIVCCPKSVQLHWVSELMAWGMHCEEAETDLWVVTASATTSSTSATSSSTRRQNSLSNQIRNWSKSGYGHRSILVMTHEALTRILNCESSVNTSFNPFFKQEELAKGKKAAAAAAKKKTTSANSKKTSPLSTKKKAAGKRRARKEDDDDQSDEQESASDNDDEKQAAKNTKNKKNKDDDLPPEEEGDDEEEDEFERMMMMPNDTHRKKPPNSAAASTSAKNSKKKSKIKNNKNKPNGNDDNDQTSDDDDDNNNNNDRRTEARRQLLLQEESPSAEEKANRDQEEKDVNISASRFELLELRKIMLQNCGILVVDEAHRLALQSNGAPSRLAEALQHFDQDLTHKILLTGTPFCGVKPFILKQLQTLLTFVEPAAQSMLQINQIRAVAERLKPKVQRSSLIAVRHLLPRLHRYTVEVPISWMQNVLLQRLELSAKMGLLTTTPTTTTGAANTATNNATDDVTNNNKKVSNYVSHLKMQRLRSLVYSQTDLVASYCKSEGGVNSDAILCQSNLSARQTPASARWALPALTLPSAPSPDSLLHNNKLLFALYIINEELRLDRKTLAFSSSLKILEILKSYLEAFGLKIGEDLEMMTGFSLAEERQAIAKRFNSLPVPQQQEFPSSDFDGEANVFVNNDDQQQQQQMDTNDPRSVQNNNYADTTNTASASSASVVAQFRARQAAKPLNVVLATTTSCGTGIELFGANRIIFLDDPGAQETQLICRAFRPGGISGRFVDEETGEFLQDDLFVTKLISTSSASTSAHKKREGGNNNKNHHHHQQFRSLFEELNKMHQLNNNNNNMVDQQQQQQFFSTTSSSSSPSSSSCDDIPLLDAFGAVVNFQQTSGAATEFTLRKKWLWKFDGDIASI